MSTEAASAPAETLTAAARDSSEYAPFRSGAAAPAPAEQPVEAAVLERNEPTPEQVWKKTISMLERLNKSLTPSVLKAWDDQPEKVQVRLTAALSDVQQKLSGVV